ncbi:MAG: ABC transporter permease [Lachnoclostridium sp.]|nr:ABC transporter permease [Lachnoclostridium sp.]
MKRFFQNIARWFVTLFRVWRREFYLVFTDLGVLLFFFGLPTAYPIVYTLIYNPEIVTDMPVVVIDNSRSARSRELVRALDATQAIKIAGYATDLPDARRAWHEKKCYGILLIPDDYDTRLSQGRQAVVTFYDDMSLLLRYRSFVSAITDVQIAQTLKITHERVDNLGLIAESVSSGDLPVNQQAVMVGDVTQGFASFVMLGVVVLILQQSMILGVTMLAGGRAERRRRNHGYDPMSIEASPVTTILGRTLCYIVIYLPLCYYILEIVPWMFSLPHLATFDEYMPFIFPMLLASALLGETVGVFVTERESSLLVVVFTSLLFLFLSGLTWPRYAFNGFWTMISALVPATWGVEGFIHMSSDGATLADINRYYINLWLLTALYFVTALLLTFFRQKSQKLPVLNN